ncbi:hypothetical protein HPB47_004154, partial [Ixodes persulcatus]
RCFTKHTKYRPLEHGESYNVPRDSKVSESCMEITCDAKRGFLEMETVVLPTRSKERQCCASGRAGAVHFQIPLIITAPIIILTT